MLKLVPDAQSVAPPRSAGGMDPLDRKKALDVYQQMQRHPKADDMVDATRTGEGPSEAAREEGLAPKQGHKIFEKTRARYTKALRYASLAVLLPGAAALLVLWSHGTSLYPWEMDIDHAPMHTEHGHVRKELGGWDDPDSLRQRAMELRQKAAAECKAGQFQQCKDDLHQADLLDPDRTALPPDLNAKPMAVAPRSPRAVALDAGCGDDPIEGDSGPCRTPMGSRSFGATYGHARLAGSRLAQDPDHPVCTLWQRRDDGACGAGIGCRRDPLHRAEGDRGSHEAMARWDPE